MKSRKRFELMILGITTISQILFFLMFLFETKGGVVGYANWKTVEGILYYSTMTYQAGKILAFGVLAVILFEVLLTIWGIYSQSYLSTLSSSLGMLIYFGMFTQVFYNAGSNLEKHILFTLIGMTAMWIYYFLIRVKLTKEQGMYIQHAIGGLIILNLLVLIVNVILKNSVNGSYAWIRIGGFSLQPGEFIKVLMILLSAWMYKYRDNRQMTKRYLGYCAAAIFVLVISRDLGNAVVLVGICLVGSWFIYDKWIYTLLAFVGGFSGLLCAGKWIPYVSRRFDACFHALESGSGQHYDSLMSILKSGLAGCGPAGDTVAATHITSSATDFTFNTFVSIWGIALACVFLLCIIAVFVQLLITPVVSPFHYLLGVLGVTTMFAQYFIHIAGNLNVIPLTGICMNFVSSGGSNMISSFLIVAGILSSMSPGFEAVTLKNEKSYVEGDKYDYKNSCKTLHRSRINDRFNDIRNYCRIRSNWKKSRYGY